MHDQPNHEGLYRLAEEQAGYFTTAQAAEYGFSRALLAHHARPGGRFERVDHGLYRVRLFPSSPQDEIVAAWVAVGPDVAVVSHESALELYDLSDVMPSAVHLTVPRKDRWRKASPWIRLHTTSEPLEGADVERRGGVRVTSPERTLLDVAKSGIGPEQLQLAIRQALERGLVTAGSLRRSAERYGGRARAVVERTVEPA